MRLRRHHGRPSERRSGRARGRDPVLGSTGAEQSIGRKDSCATSRLRELLSSPALVRQPSRRAADQLVGLGSFPAFSLVGHASRQRTTAVQARCRPEQAAAQRMGAASASLWSLAAASSSGVEQRKPKLLGRSPSGGWRPSRRQGAGTPPILCGSCISLAASRPLPLSPRPLPISFNLNHGLHYCRSHAGQGRRGREA